ncbi:MAG: DUF5719 family protein [Actinomycetes bacterium]|jgi:Family of unknown function (DUF5719)
MKLRNLLVALLPPLLIATALTLSTLIPEARARIVLDGSYPAVVCPGAISGGSERISLPAKNISTRFVAGSSANLKVQKSTVITGSSAPTFVGGNPGSEIAFLTLSGASTADAVCEVGGIDQWFIGGSAGVTSQGVLEIINSGLSDSLVQVFPYSSKVALAPISVKIKANSAKDLPLASLVPGEESIALHVVTESGRVSSFLLDHRKNGLSELGASFVTPVEAPAKSSYISGLFGSATKATSIMRFLVPGNISATVHLTIHSGGGVITPLGFDSLTVAKGRVVDLPLPKISLSTPYGIEVSSDQPIFASILTKRTSGGVDFAWANQLTPIANFKINLAGASGQFFFMGHSVAIKAQWIDSKGKANTAVITGDLSAAWHPTGPLTGITFTPLTKDTVYGGALISNSDGGLNYLPLLANQLISRGQIPNADLRTLARH